MTYIRLRDVSRTYSSRSGIRVDALRDVDVEIERGDFVAIVGPSGGGKSTLMNVLGLMDDATSGEYFLDDERLRAADDQRAAAVRAESIGFVFQAFHLLEGRPVIDNVELTLLYRGVPRRERTAVARAAIRAVGLDEKERSSTTTLSGGQRQRVAIARAIAADAPLLLADEPTGNLDSRSAEGILDELERLNRAGTTVVVVTHSEDVAARARRVISLVDGRVVSDTGRGHADPPDTASPGQGRPGRRRGRLRAGDLVRDAWASVLSRRARMYGQSFAVAIAVALAITTLGLSSSSRAQISAAFDAHLNREVSARWTTSVAHSPPVIDVPARVQALSGVDAAAVLLDLPAGTAETFAGGFQTRPHVAIGDIAAAARLTIAEASWHDGPLGPDEVFVGDLLAAQLQLGSVEAAPRVRVNEADYVVAGLITESSRLPLLRGELIVGTPTDPAAIHAYEVTVLAVTAAGAAPQVARQLPSALNPFHPETITITAPTDSATLRGEVEQGVQVTLTAFTLLALIVAIAALANSTLLGVQERRGEIGMRKAVGARSRHIGALITLESAYVGVVGGVIGLFLGMMAILAITISQRWTPVFDVRLVPLALVAGLVVGAGGGGIASLRAARLRPADNLRS